MLTGQEVWQVNDMKTRIVNPRRFAAAVLIGSCGLYAAGSGINYCIKKAAPVFRHGIVEVMRDPMERYVDSHKFVKKYGTVNDVRLWAGAIATQDEVSSSEDVNFIKKAICEKTAQETGDNVNKREAGMSYVWYVPADGE